VNVYWLEQTQAHPPLSDAWLSAAESHLMSRLRFAKRHADWRLGRWTAKLAIATYLNVAPDFQTLALLEILPQPSGAPRALFDSMPLPITISISHSAGMAICAMASHLAPMGCDLELIEPRADSFVADYFTADEQELIAGADDTDRDLRVTLLWSAKESALKAIGEGLRIDTRCVAVIPHLASRPLVDWQPLKVQRADGQPYYGWWQTSGPFVQTVVSASTCNPPVWLGKTA